MFKNNKLGLKVAENKDEAFWIKLKEESTERIDSLKREIIINEEIVKLATRKSTNLNIKVV